MHIKLDKTVDLNYNMECASIVLCKCIAHVSGFQSCLRSLYDLWFKRMSYFLLSCVGIHTIKSLTLSYNPTLKIHVVQQIYKVSSVSGSKEGALVKFVGDNVDKKKGVHDVLSDHQNKMHNIYSLLTIKARTIVDSLL